MKKIKGMFKKLLSAIPGASDPETLEEAQETIESNQSYRKTLARVSHVLGSIAATGLVLAVLTKAGVIVVGTLAFAGLYGAARGAIGVLDRDTRSNKVAELRFLAAKIGDDATSPGVKPLPDTDLGSTFKGPASKKRVAELEKQLADLEKRAAEKRREAKLSGHTL